MENMDPLFQIWSGLTLLLFQLIDNLYLGPLHTRDWEPVTITLQPLSLVEKAEPVQVRFTLHFIEGPREYWSARRMLSLHGFLHGIKWIMFHGHSDYFQKPLLGGRLNSKPEDHGTPNVHNRWFIIFNHVWRPAWIENPWNNIWLKAQSHMTLLLEYEGVLGLSLDTSFGLSQFHDHGSWLVCEVALQVVMNDVGVAKLKFFLITTNVW